MLIEDVKICHTLRRIISRLTADQALQEDLMQECLIRLWQLESKEPGRTRSWYLQNCRFHLQHWLASGRSLDSRKRANGDKRITLDGDNDALPEGGYHTNGEFLEVVSAHDIVSALAGRLKPQESAVLGSLADGLVLHDIAVKHNLSYPTALKYRRKIAALTIKLGISPPMPHNRDHARPARRAHRAAHHRTSVQINGVKRHNSLVSVFRTTPANCGEL
jgi:DNA-directed RNA polymerase specialized sigma24 family protein